MLTRREKRNPLTTFGWSAALLVGLWWSWNTFAAEMSAEEKDRISHRGIAVRRLSEAARRGELGIVIGERPR